MSYKKNKSVWNYKGIINTFDQVSGKFTKQYVKGKVTFLNIWEPFILVTVEPKDNTPSYRNIFMRNYDQIIGSFGSNDQTIFYLEPDGNLRAKFYTGLTENKTKFGNLKLFVRN